jgi:ATP-dependent Clp protease ATP-binding subunit ClpC
MFKSLTREGIHLIIDLELAKLYGRINSLAYQIEFTEKANDIISDKGYDEKYGARPLKRAIQRWVDDIITDYIIENNPEEGTNFLIDYNSDDEISFISCKNEKIDKPEKVKKTRKKKDE